MQKLTRRTALALGASALAAAATGWKASAAEPSGTVVWWSWDPTQDEGDRYVKQFMEAYPNIKLEYHWQVYSDYVPALKLSLASGDAPDVWFTEPGALVTQQAQFAEDLAPYAAKEWGADWAKNWITSPLQSAVRDNVQVGLPWVDLGAGTLWYNKTIFDKNGLQPPKTLKEWQDVATKLKAAGVIPFVQGASEDWINFDHFMAIANQVVPGKLYDADKGKIAWTDPGLVKAMDIWKSLFDLGIMQPGALANTQYPDAQDLYSSEKAAMIMQGTWFNNSMTKAGMALNEKTYGAGITFESVPMQYPDITGDGKGAPMTVGADTIAMMSKDSSNKDATWAFIAFMVSDKVQRQKADELQIPAIAAEHLDPALVMTDTQRQGLALEQQLMQASSYPRKLDGVQSSTALGVALQKVASGQQNAADALADVDKAAQKDKAAAG